jgi:hypothetical protein
MLGIEAFATPEALTGLLDGERGDGCCANEKNAGRLGRRSFRATNSAKTSATPNSVGLV